MFFLIIWEQVTHIGLFYLLNSLLIHTYGLTAAAKSLQSCLTLCDPIDCSPPGSSVPGILQAIILEWVTNSFSNVWAQLCPILCDPMDGSLLGSFVHGIFQQEYWSGLQFSTSEDLPYPGIKSVSSALSGRFFTNEPRGKPPNTLLCMFKITDIHLYKHNTIEKSKTNIIDLNHIFPVISSLSFMVKNKCKIKTNLSRI